MKSYELEISNVCDGLNKEIAKLKSLRDTFYVDTQGNQFHNALAELHKRNMKFQDDTLNAILEYPNADSINAEINVLQGITEVLKAKISA